MFDPSIITRVKKKLKLIILGGASNILFANKVINAVVVKIGLMHKIIIKENKKDKNDKKGKKK